jgi:hypothetical protein
MRRCYLAPGTCALVCISLSLRVPGGVPLPSPHLPMVRLMALMTAIGSIIAVTRAAGWTGGRVPVWAGGKVAGDRLWNQQPVGRSARGAVRLFPGLNQYRPPLPSFSPDVGMSCGPVAQVPHRSGLYVVHPTGVLHVSTPPSFSNPNPQPQRPPSARSHTPLSSAQVELAHGCLAARYARRATRYAPWPGGPGA